MNMATKKKTGAKAKKRPLKAATYADDGAAFVDKFTAVLNAAGDMTTPPGITLAALLGAARGVALVLASLPGDDGRSIYDIGSAHALVDSLPAEWLHDLTEGVVLKWAGAPAVCVCPRPGSKSVARKPRKRKARS
jgi:hypothetical protein